MQGPREMIRTKFDDSGLIDKKNKDLRLFWIPKPIKVAMDKHDQSKHCTFHNDKGYITNDCNPLIIQIEHILQQGHLQKYQLNPNPKIRSPNDLDIEDKISDSDDKLTKPKMVEPVDSQRN